MLHEIILLRSLAGYVTGSFQLLNFESVDVQPQIEAKLVMLYI